MWYGHTQCMQGDQKHECFHAFRGYYGAVSISVFVLFILPGTLPSHLLRQEPWQMDRSSCRAWRRASIQAETGTGTVGEAAAGTQ